jgi:hypothetical protein
MMFEITYRLSSSLTAIVSAAWSLRIFAKIFGWTVPPIVSHMFFNLRPFYFPALAVVTLYAIRHGDMSVVDYIFNAFSWVGGFWIRNDKDDDDRWKRRREKLAAKVQETGGKLTVVPVGSNA